MPTGRVPRWYSALCISFAAINFATFLSIGMQEILVYFDPAVSLIIYFGGFVVGMAIMPVLLPATMGESNRASRDALLISLTTALAVLELAWLFNICVGAFFRGPNWNFFWPWEERDPFRVVVQNHVDLSQLFWHWLSWEERPRSWLVRESPGVVLLAIFLLVIPLGLARFLKTKASFAGIRYWRLAAALILVQLMALLPLKMWLRAWLNVKYFVATPDFMFNV